MSMDEPTQRELPISNAFERNAAPILEVLQRALPLHGAVLEVGSGPGQHAAYFGRALSRAWYPSEVAGNLDGIAAWRAQPGVAQWVQPARTIDLCDPRWDAPVTIDALCAVVAINVIHIAPWEAGLALLAGASRLLPVGGVLYLYGPYRDRTRPLEPSNAAFDASIQARFPGAGLREVQAVIEAAREVGFALGGDAPMPANNRSLWFVREA